MDEQTTTVVEDTVVVSQPQPPVETVYTREQLTQMIKDSQDRIDSNTSDRDNYQAMLDLLPEIKIEEPVEINDEQSITR